MIKVLWFLGVLVVIAAGAAWLADRPGEISVLWQGYHIETSVTVAVVAALATIVVVLIIWALLRFVFRVPDLMSVATRGRRRARGFEALSRGLIAVGSGEPELARRHALKAEKFLGVEPMTLLLRAQAAQLSGDRKVAEAAFTAMLEAPETRILGLRGLYVEARRRGDVRGSSEYAARAAQLAPAVGWANEAMLEHLGAARKWREALALLERRVAAGRMDRALAKRQRAVLLTADALDNADSDPERALTDARQAVKLAPDLVPAAVLQGRLLSRQGALRKASRVLEASWKLSPHPEIAAACIDIRPGDSALDRLARARNLARLTPGHEEARIILARTAIDAREYDVAREALEPLLKVSPPARVCLMMAEIAEHAPAGAGAVREWLARASRAPRDPAWIADGVVSDHWQPLSPVTGRLDAFVWTTPNELLAAHPGADAADDVIADAHEPEAAPWIEIAPPAAVTTPTTTPAPASEAAAAAPVQAEGEIVGVPVAPASPGPTPAVAAAQPLAAVSSLDGEAQERAAPRSTSTSTSGTSRPRVAPRRTDVLFPIARAPDDPGPDGESLGDEPTARPRINV